MVAPCLAGFEDRSMASDVGTSESRSGEPSLTVEESWMERGHDGRRAHRDRNRRRRHCRRRELCRQF